MRLLQILVPELQIATIVRRYGWTATSQGTNSTRVQHATLNTVTRSVSTGTAPSTNLNPRTNLATKSGNTSGEGAGRVLPIIAPAREEEWKQARQQIANLQGSGIREIETTLEAIRATISQGISAGGAGYVFLVSAERGTGKTTLSTILPRLLFGANIVDSRTVHDLRSLQPTGGEHGIWVADDADEVLKEPEVAAQWGRAYLRANATNTRNAVMLLIGSSGFAERLSRLESAEMWLRKCEIHNFTLPALSDSELTIVAQNIGEDMGFTLDRGALRALSNRIAQERTGVGLGRTFDSVGTVVQLMTIAKRAAVLDNRRTIVAEDFA